MIPRPPGVRDDWGRANDEDQKRECWRWHFAGQIAPSEWATTNEEAAQRVVAYVDALIAELEKEPKK